MLFRRRGLTISTHNSCNSTSPTVNVLFPLGSEVVTPRQHAAARALDMLQPCITTTPAGATFAG